MLPAIEDVVLSVIILLRKHTKDAAFDSFSYDIFKTPRRPKSLHIAPHSALVYVKMRQQANHCTKKMHLPDVQFFIGQRFSIVLKTNAPTRKSKLTNKKMPPYPSSAAIWLASRAEARAPNVPADC